MKLYSLNVLLIAPEFYTYHDELIRSMTKLGANVTFIQEMDQSIKYRLLGKFNNRFKCYFERKHISKILSVSKSQKFDAVFIIRGGYFTPKIIKQLKENTPSAKFYLYQWDSYKQNDYRSIITFFDSVSTFDSKDADELNLAYEPLFYTDVYRDMNQVKGKKLYDLVFYGAYHSDRLVVIKYFEKLLSEARLIFKSHLYIKKIPLIFRLLKREISFSDLRYFKTYSVSATEIAQSYSRTKAVLDIELLIQSGLSIRTFEVLGSGAKLITTNSNIVKEKFYNPEQIMHIDRNAIKADLSFFISSGKKCDMKCYHIDAWLKRILKSAY